MIDIKSIQQVLALKGYYSGAIDGLAGPKTYAAVEAGLSNFHLNVNWSDWSPGRLRIAFMQAFFRDQDIETGIVDGYMGPQTAQAFEIYQHLRRTGKPPDPWRDDITVETKADTPVSNNWPRQRSLKKFYGDVGRNQTILTLPFEMKIAWNKKQIIKRFSIHEKCHDSALRVFTKINSHYSPEERAEHGMDLFGGCLNVRKMRGGSRWSTHAWGIAIDFDPIRNQLRWGRDRAYFDAPECEQFWKFWEEEGWLSLGRAKNFDWMHCQAARL